MNKIHIKILKKQLIWRYIFCGVLLFALEFFTYLINDYNGFQNQSSFIITFMFVAIGVTLLSFVFTKNIKTDLQDRKLNKYEKTVDKKTEHAIIEPWIYRNRKPKPDIKYFLHSKGVSYRVDEELYTKMSEGNTFYVLYAPSSKIEFEVET